MGKIFLLAFLNFAHVSCSDTEILSGIWDNKEGEKVDLTPIYGSSTKGYIQLVIGHFGPEASGIVSFFPDDKSDQGFCNCRYMCDAKFSSNKLEFEIPTPKPPCDPCSPETCNSCEIDGMERIKALFEYDPPTDTMSGTLKTNPPIKFNSLERKTSKEDIAAHDKRCDNY